MTSIYTTGTYKAKSITLSIAVLLGVTAVYYLFLIAQFPQFYMDDYYIFSKVPASSLPFGADISERYYLFVRPVEFFYFWVIYFVSGANAIVMKGIGLLVLLLVLATTFHVIKKIESMFSMTIHQGALLAACLIFAFHPDVASSVLWISNVNEILMTLLYALSVYFLLDAESRPGALALSIIFFLLSSLVKQQSLHYPFLVVFLLILKWRSLNAGRRKNLIIVVVIGAGIVVAHSIANYLIYVRASDVDIVGALWKKPFSILGTMLYLLVPFGGDDLYFHLMVHKKIAALVMAPILLLLFLLVYLFSKKGLLKTIRSVGGGLIFILIIFFPRIFAPGGIRLNTIQLFWLTVGLSVFFSAKFRFKQILPAVFLIINLLATQKLIAKYQRVDAQTLQAASSLRSASDNWSAQTYIVSGPSTKLLGYVSNYQTENRFGNSRKYGNSPVEIYSFDERELNFQDVTVVKDGAKFSVAIRNQAENRMFLGADFASRERITNTENSTLRGYAMIEFESFLALNDSTVKFVYYDGVRWHTLNN